MVGTQGCGGLPHCYYEDIVVEVVFVFRSAHRRQNDWSIVVRDAWDGGDAHVWLGYYVYIDVEVWLEQFMHDQVPMQCKCKELDAFGPIGTL